MKDLLENSQSIVFVLAIRCKKGNGWRKVTDRSSGETDSSESSSSPSKRFSNEQIDTCNDFYCENFKPNRLNRRCLLNSGRTAWYTQFGGPIPRRPAEDVAFSVARFVQNNGSFFNYYMIHIFRSSSDPCAAFLTNSVPHFSTKLTFQNVQYDLPPWSISILISFETVYCL